MAFSDLLFRCADRAVSQLRIVILSFYFDDFAEKLLDLIDNLNYLSALFGLNALFWIMFVLVSRADGKEKFNSA